VRGFKGKFNEHSASPKDHILHDVAISREGGDEQPDELLANGRVPLDEAARNLNRHIFRVVGHDEILIRASPHAIVFVKERFDISVGSQCSSGRHGYTFPASTLAENTGEG